MLYQQCGSRITINMCFSLQPASRGSLLRNKFNLISQKIAQNSKNWAILFYVYAFLPQYRLYFSYYALFIVLFRELLFTILYIEFLLFFCSNSPLALLRHYLFLSLPLYMVEHRATRYFVQKEVLLHSPLSNKLPQSMKTAGKIDHAGKIHITCPLCCEQNQYKSIAFY